MVKVTIENDKNKDEITGEFFMGLMLTKEEETEDSTTYKACAIGRGDTCVQDLPNNVAKWIVDIFGAVYKTKLDHVAAWRSLPSVWRLRSTRHLRRVRVRLQMK